LKEIDAEFLPIGQYMATLFTNGTETIKLYESINRGKPLYQLAYWAGGRRVQRNFSDEAKAKRTAKRVLGTLAEDSEAVDNLNTPLDRHPPAG
jgi:hypothetical protein